MKTATPVTRAVTPSSQIAYTESGSGEPLILLHGAESARQQFDVFRPLLGPGIHSISYDQRDTGDTINSDDPYDMARLGDDLADLVDALGFDRVHVFGSSFGGMVAINFAIDHPERVQSLILGATTPSLSMIAAETLLSLTPEERPAYMLDVLLTPEGRAADPTLLADSAAALRPRSAEADARRRRAGEHYDRREQMFEITAPTLLVHGEDDPLMPVGNARWMAERIPDATLAVLPGTRHGITFENRELTAAHVREFVLGHPVQR